MRIEPIGHIESPYLTKFGVPRQPDLADIVESCLVLDPSSSNVLEPETFKPGYPMIVLWAFSHNLDAQKPWSLTVRPPRLGGNERMGVFATRSSFRPNGLALSIVEISCIDNGRIYFRGGDMVDGSPVYWIRIYEEGHDAHEEASSGWAGEHIWPILDDVRIPETLSSRLDLQTERALRQVLAQDPRPAYTRNYKDDRIFWTIFDRFVIWFKVTENVLQVVDLVELSVEDVQEVKASGTLPDHFINQNM